MLKGDKVILRAVERADVQRIHDIRQDVELTVLAFGDWQPFPLEQFEKNFEERLKNNEQTWFAIEVDKTLIGLTGLHGLERRDGVAELGIGIYDRQFLGQGYGRDAIKVILRWAFRIQNWRRIWLTTIAPNERAIRSYLACGFIEEGRLREHAFFDGKYVDMVTMGILRSEWEAQQEALQTGDMIDSASNKA